MWSILFESRYYRWLIHRHFITQTCHVRRVQNRRNFLCVQIESLNGRPDLADLIDVKDILTEVDVEDPRAKFCCEYFLITSIQVYLKNVSCGLIRIVKDVASVVDLSAVKVERKKAVVSVWCNRDIVRAVKIHPANACDARMA